MTYEIRALKHKNALIQLRIQPSRVSSKAEAEEALSSELDLIASIHLPQLNGLITLKYLPF